MPLDLLALAAHRDDVEQTCAGTLLKMAERGYRTGILALTQGEMATRSPGGASASPYRPFTIICAIPYGDVRATFVLDITNQFATRFASVIAYKSQFTDQEAGSGIFPAQKENRARVESMARFYGMMGGV